MRYLNPTTLGADVVIEGQANVWGLIYQTPSGFEQTTRDCTINSLGFTISENKVTGIGLYNQGLTSLPQNIGNLTNLQELWLSKD